MAQLREDQSHVVTFVVRGPKSKGDVVKYMKALRRAVRKHKAKITQKKTRHRAKARRRGKRRRRR